MPTTGVTEHAHEVIAATLGDPEISQPVCTGAFPADADQVACARALVQDRLADHPAREIAVLLANELATNAVRHSRSDFFALVINLITTDHVHITVVDEGRAGIPHLHTTSADAESGRGMSIVDLLATRWGITRRPGVGTAVWFECAGE